MLRLSSLLFLNESSVYSLASFYHGGAWDGRKPLKTTGRGALGTGAYLTPNRSIAEDYAKEVSGVVAKTKVKLTNPLVINMERGSHEHPCVKALTSLGMDEAKATKLVEKVEEQKGYMGKEISNLAMKQGYDGIAEYYNGELREVVVWNSAQVTFEGLVG